MKHDALTETLQRLGFPQYEAQGSVSLLHRSSHAEKRALPGVVNGSRGQASSCSSPLSKGLDWIVT